MLTVYICYLQLVLRYFIELVTNNRNVSTAYQMVNTMSAFNTAYWQ